MAMQDDKKPCPGQDAEHKFCNKQQRRENKNDLKVIKIWDVRQKKGKV